MNGKNLEMISSPFATIDEFLRARPNSIVVNIGFILQSPSGHLSEERCLTIVRADYTLRMS